MPVVAQRKANGILPRPLGHGRRARQRQVDGDGHHRRDDQLRSVAGPGEHAPQPVGEPPQEAEPDRATVERVVQVDEERRSGPEHASARIKGTRGVRNVMQDAEAVGEVQRAVADGRSPTVATANVQFSCAPRARRATPIAAELASTQVRCATRGATSRAQRPLTQPMSAPWAPSGRSGHGKMRKYSKKSSSCSFSASCIWLKVDHSSAKPSTVDRCMFGLAVKTQSVYEP